MAGTLKITGEPGWIGNEALAADVNLVLDDFQSDVPGGTVAVLQLSGYEVGGGMHGEAGIELTAADLGRLMATMAEIIAADARARAEAPVRSRSCKCYSCVKSRADAEWNLTGGGPRPGVEDFD